MQGWDPVANNGIAVWAISGNGDDGWVTLLDGNGYLWNCGENNYGNFADGTTNNNSS